MSLSDCPKCWETPCVCGREYRNLSGAERLKLGAAVLGIPPGQLAVLLASSKPESLVQENQKDQQEEDVTLTCGEERSEQLQKLLDAKRKRLQCGELAKQLHQYINPGDTMHSYWDLIFDLKAFANNKPEEVFLKDKDVDWHINKAEEVLGAAEAAGRTKWR